MNITEIVDALLEDILVEKFTIGMGAKQGTDIHPTLNHAYAEARRTGQSHIADVLTGKMIPATSEGIKKHLDNEAFDKKRMDVASNDARLYGHIGTPEKVAAQSTSARVQVVDHEAEKAALAKQVAARAAARAASPTAPAGLRGQVAASKKPGPQNSGFDYYNNLLEGIIDSFLEDTMSGQVASYAMPLQGLVGQVQDGVKSFDDNFVNTPDEVKKRKHKRGKKDRLGQIATAMALAVGT